MVFLYFWGLIFDGYSEILLFVRIILKDWELVRFRGRQIEGEGIRLGDKGSEFSRWLVDLIF